MSNPAKRRKMNSSGKQNSVPARGLEYYFSKQKHSGTSSSNTPKQQGTIAGTPEQKSEGHLTDEELARKLQAEWDAEVTGSSDRSSSLPLQDGDGVNAQGSNRSDQDVPPQESVLGKQPAAVDPVKGKNTLSLSSAAATEDQIASSLPLDESPLAFEPAKYIPQLQASWAAEGGDATYALLTRCFVLVNATNAISPPYISMELGLGGSAISKALKQACGLDNRALKSLYDKLGDPGDVAFEAKKKQSFTLRKPKPLTIKGVFQSLVKIAKAQGQGSGDVKQRIVDRLLQDARGGEESRYIVRTLCQHLRIGAVKTTMLIALSRAFLLSRPPGAEFATQDPKALAKLKKEELAEVWARSEELVKASHARHPDYNDLIPILLEIGISEELLVRCGLTLHIPLRPMLGSITRDLSEMLTKLQGRDFTCEYKYDGQRAQVHCDSNGKVSIFSRHLELMTDKYPDLVALVPKIRGEGVESFILEGEVVAVDRATGELKNFQTLTNRARKDVAIGAITIDVCLFAFDLMYLNGQPLLDQPFRHRRDLLRSLFVEIPHHFTWVKSLDATSQDSEPVLEFFKSALDSKCEGIMVKLLDNLPNLEYNPQEGGPEQTEPKSSSNPTAKNNRSKSKRGDNGSSNSSSNNNNNNNCQDNNNNNAPVKGRRKPLLATYEPDKRLDSWLKVKKDYSASSETLDLIPIAAWHGQGRKAKWWSPILLAVRNEETGCLEAVCKCMSGFTDAFYKANREFYDDGDADGEGGGTRERRNTHARKPAFVDYAGGVPDVWFEPCEVWEVAFADITVSPTYTAAIGLAKEDRGLSLRFPRFLRKREDKGIEEASTSAYLAALWRKQEARAPKTTENVGQAADDDEMNDDDAAAEE
ncbi:hypothetical protein VTH82DRAFT_6203 [Thermothelomyces myriococcoides]